ncbi:MAG TPA: hypothetical protein VNN17_12695 [Terriglobia bacterium]|nr:hypothetical protein [Terriglobia bacterium]
MKGFIQFQGFVVSRTDRAYHFVVTNGEGASRQFCVTVPLESFRKTPLKFQDGPLITLERLKQELEAETADSHANPRLSIGTLDIQGYLERHYPPKARTWTAFGRS